MTDYISAELRRRVADRAQGACEYCLIRQDDTFVGCQIDHVIALKHGGATEFENLAFACAVCNRAKGSDIASLLPGTQTPIRLFNPRVDRWDDHFQVDAASLVIKPLTDIGDVTAKLLGFNESERVIERQALAEIGRYAVARPRPK